MELFFNALETFTAISMNSGDNYSLINAVTKILAKVNISSPELMLALINCNRWGLFDFTFNAIRISSKRAQRIACLCRDASDLPLSLK